MSIEEKSPSQHAAFLQHAATVDFQLNQSESESGHSVQSQFDLFYTIAHNLLEMFYPERTVTITSRDPPYITGYIKSMLRRKNRLMRRGRVEEASALAQRIGKEITRRTKTQLKPIQGNVDSRKMWACVRRLTGKKPHDDHVEGISAESLNNHYCKISTDPNYVAPLLKLTVGNSDEKYIDEYKIFGVLDTLRPTATGLDGLPAWFLRTGAPVFCQPLTHLFNISLSTSTVPRQWKQAWIRPVAKVAVPTQHADRRATGLLCNSRLLTALSKTKSCNQNFNTTLQASINNLSTILKAMHYSESSCTSAQVAVSRRTDNGPTDTPQTGSGRQAAGGTRRGAAQISTFDENELWQGQN